ARTIPVPEHRTKDLGSFWVRGASMHNLKNIDVEFPVGKFVCVTGVSGSGKSTLVNEIVYKSLANRLHRMRVKPGEHESVETLEVRFKGKSIADVLAMSVEEALAFFAKIPKLRRKLQTLHDVGLDYIKLGQPATTLSGGEAQRIKLAKELSKVATGRTLYMLDEPTTGLHFADIEKLLDVLQRLVD